MTRNKPYWELLKQCAERLSLEGRTPFTRRGLIACVQAEHPYVGKNSLNPAIQGMTVNLRGGPGGPGKKVLFSVGRGLFELYDPEKYSDSSPLPQIAKVPQQPRNVDSPRAKTKREMTEDKVRDLLMQVLYDLIGEEGSWEGYGKGASFKLRGERGLYKCYAEKSLPYTLPSGYEMSHASDILIIDEARKKFVSIEIKHLSAVTDQFKCRSYDMSHMKSTYGDNLLGILVYVKEEAKGISPEHAKSICYPFDRFFAVPSEFRHFRTTWARLISAIEAFL